MGRTIPRGSRNTLARGLIISRLTYLISIWGVTTDNHIRKTQSLLNAAARWVTGQYIKVKISSLLEETSWFSISEIIKLNSATLMWKVLNRKPTRKLYEDINCNMETMEITIMEPRLLFTEQSFTLRASRELNCTRLPKDK